MKESFPAYYIEPDRNPALPFVTVRPCHVTQLFPARPGHPASASILLHSLTAAGTVARIVPVADLTSRLETAVQRVQKRIASFQPVPAEKSAVHSMAGAGAGKSSPNA